MSNANDKFLQELRNQARSKTDGESFNMTPEEINRIEEVMKEDEFRKLLFEYMDELRNPEYRQETEQYLRQLEANGEVPSNVHLVRPKSGFAIQVPLRRNAPVPSPSSSSSPSSTGTGNPKTSNVSTSSPSSSSSNLPNLSDKVYINIVHDTAVDPPVIHAPDTSSSPKNTKKNTPQSTGVQLPSAVGSGRHEKDLTNHDPAQNNLVLTFDVCFHPDTVAQCIGKTERAISFRDAVCQAAIELVDKRMKQVALPASILPVKDGLHFVERKYTVLTDVRCVGDQPAPLNLPKKDGGGNDPKNSGSSSKETKKSMDDKGLPNNNNNNSKVSSSASPTPSLPVMQPAKHSTVIKTGSSSSPLTVSSFSPPPPPPPGIFIPKIELVHRGNFDMLDHLMNPLIGSTATGPSSTPVLPSTQRPKELVVRISLPGVTKVSHVECDIEEQSVNIQTADIEIDGKKGKYSYIYRLPYPINTEDDEPAKWDKTKALLTLTLKVKPPPKVETVPFVSTPTASLVQELDNDDDEEKKGTLPKTGTKETTTTTGHPPPKVEESHSKWVKQREAPVTTVLPAISSITPSSPANSPVPESKPSIVQPSSAPAPVPSSPTTATTTKKTEASDTEDNSLRAGGEPPFRWRQTNDVVTIIFDLPSVDKHSILIETNQKIQGNHTQNIRISMQTTVSPLQLYERKHGPLNLPPQETTSSVPDKYVYATELPLFSYVELPSTGSSTSSPTGSRYDVSDENVVIVLKKARLEGIPFVAKWNDLRRSLDDTDKLVTTAVPSSSSTQTVAPKETKQVDPPVIPPATKETVPSSSPSVPVKVSHETKPVPPVPSSSSTAPATPSTPSAAKKVSPKPVKSTPKPPPPEPETVEEEEEEVFELGPNGVFDITPKRNKPKVPKATPSSSSKSSSSSSSSSSTTTPPAPKGTPTVPTPTSTAPKSVSTPAPVPVSTPTPKSTDTPSATSASKPSSAAKLKSLLTELD